MKRRKIILVTLLIISILLVSCGEKLETNSESSSDQPKQAQEGKTRIAFIPKTLNHPFFLSMEDGAREAANKAGNVELIVQAAERETDVERQMQIMENLIAQKVDAILLAPSGSKEVVPVVKKANEAGIPVLALDTKVDEQAMKEQDASVVSFIGSDNYEGGKVAAKYIGDALNGKGNVAILEGISGHETGDARLNGFKDAIKEYPDIRIVASQTANWERAQGFDVFQNMLQANPDINALFACNDLMALGAVEAIEVAGKTGKIIVVGFDANDDAKQAIKEGRMAGSIAQFPSEMGRLGVEKALEYLKGSKVDSHIGTKIDLIDKGKL